MGVDRERHQAFAAFDDQRVTFEALRQLGCAAAWTFVPFHEAGA